MLLLTGVTQITVVVAAVAIGYCCCCCNCCCYYRLFLVCLPTVVHKPVGNNSHLTNVITNCFVAP